MIEASNGAISNGKRMFVRECCSDEIKYDEINGAVGRLKGDNSSGIEKDKTDSL